MTSIQHDHLAAPEGAAQGDPTSVYRYYDGHGILIYVGITRQGMGRNAQHNSKAEWWPLVARQEVEHLPNRAAAMLREKALIRRYQPPFNKQHNPDHAELKATYQRYIAGQGEPEDRASLVRDINRHLPLEIVEYDRRVLVLRSRLEHGQIAGSVQRGDDMAVRGRRRRYGTVNNLVARGPVLTVVCHLRGKTNPPLEFVKAEAILGWANNKKPPFPYIKQVLVVEDDI